MPSNVSIRDMPLANKHGNTKMYDEGIDDAFIAVKPSNATSEAVSNPKKKEIKQKINEKNKKKWEKKNKNKINENWIIENYIFWTFEKVT